MSPTRFRTAAAGVLAAALLVAGGWAPAHWVRAAPAPEPRAERPDQTKEGGALQAYESLNGKLALNWQPVRPDPTHVSLSTHPGRLTITTQRGTIHGDANAHGEPFAKNIFVLPNPLAKEADFVMTTCLIDFTPTVAFQQAGLICYDDDDNYLKWSYEFNHPQGKDQYFCLVREVDAKPDHFPTRGVSGLQKVWMRLTKRGKSYEYATSTDGKTFNVRGVQDWIDAPKMLGIIAKNGGPEGVPEIDAQFGFFELRSPAPPPEDDGKK